MAKSLTDFFGVHIPLSFCKSFGLQAIQTQVILLPKKNWVKVNRDVRESVRRDIIMNTTNEMQLYGLIYYPSQRYMFRATFSPIIRSTWNSSMTPAGSDIGEYYQML